MIFYFDFGGKCDEDNGEAYRDYDILACFYSKRHLVEFKFKVSSWTLYIVVGIPPNQVKYLTFSAVPYVHWARWRALGLSWPRR